METADIHVPALSAESGPRREAIAAGNGLPWPSELRRDQRSATTPAGKKALMGLGPPFR